MILFIRLLAITIFYMHLSSKIISQNSEELKKELQCYFDHPFQLVHKQNGKTEPLSSLVEHSIAPYIFETHEQGKHNQCIVVYKYLFNAQEIFTIAKQKNDVTVEVIQYDHKYKTMEIKMKLPSDNFEKLKFGDQCTIIVEIKSNSKVTKVFLLPFSRGEEETLISRAIHQNFKILKVIRQFLMLQASWKGNLQFQEPIFRHLSTFLYTQRVRVVKTVLWIEDGQFDRKLLQQVGQLKLPQPWLEKEEYRVKKQEMFHIKTEEQLLQNTFRRQKEQFCGTINCLQKLSGLTPQNYQEINIESLKALKQEGFVQKTAEIKELQNILAKLQIREANLKERKAECKSKMVETQKKHVSQILALKKQVGALQQVKKEGTSSFGLIFNRSRKSTDNPVIKTLFANVGKPAKKIDKTDTQFNRISENQYNRPSDNSQNQTLSDAKKKTLHKKDQFKNNEKKVASVVKDGKDGIPIDKQQLREDYENQMLKIDFEMEKRYNDMLARYEQAAKHIRNAMDENQEINI